MWRVLVVAVLLSVAAAGCGGEDGERGPSGAGALQARPETGGENVGAREAGAVRSGSRRPTPTAKPTRAPTATPEATATPEPSMTAEPTSTP